MGGDEDDETFALSQEQVIRMPFDGLDETRSRLLLRMALAVG
jgi:hypothetical protein